MISINLLNTACSF